MKQIFLFFGPVTLLSILMISCEKEAPKPVALFTMSKTTAVVDESISFTNTSEHATSYAWDFGDGNTSSDENPTHSYSSVGNFSVTLTATGEGGEHSHSESITIAHPAPNAGFLINKSTAEPGDTIIFTNTSANATSYIWDFGDGNTSTDKNPVHAYASDGVFTITLTATGEGGEDISSKSVTIAYPNAVAQFTMDKPAAEPGDTIHFTNTSENSISYSWDFGDGQNSSDENPTHIYTSFDKYTVTLTATGQGTGNSDTKTASVIVYDSEISVAGVDGNVYEIVTIGSMVWTTEDLKAVHYPDGSAIPLVTSNEDWAKLESNDAGDAYAFYDDEVYSDFGAVYTWAAAKDVCPEGFRLPDEGDWYDLIVTVADRSGDFYVNSGKKLKSTFGWKEGGNGTDDYDFHGKPGVWRESGGYWRAVSQFSRGESVFWWAEGTSDSTANAHYLHYDNNDLRWSRDTKKSRGFHVRCVKE